MAQRSPLLIGTDDSFYRQVLTRNIRTLIEDLNPQPVLDTLLAEEFIPFTQVRDIQEQLLTSQKNRKIVEFVITRGRDGYQNFKKCLIKCGQRHIADSLERAEKELRSAAQMEQTQRASGFEITNRVPTDADLMDIAQNIGNNWEFVGTRLSIPASKIDQIKMDNPTTEMRIFKLFLLWRNSQPNSNTLDKLLAVLQDLKGSVTLELEKIQDIANRKPENSNINIQRDSPINQTPVARFRRTTFDGNMMRDQSEDFHTEEDHTFNSTAFKDRFGLIRMKGPDRTNIYEPNLPGIFSGKVGENSNVMDGPPVRPGKHDNVDAGREDIDTLQHPTPSSKTLTEESIDLISSLQLSELSRMVYNRQTNPSQMADIIAPKPVAQSSVSPVEPESIETKTNDVDNLDVSSFQCSPEKAKAELSMSPHDGRLRTPSVECFKYVIGNKAKRLGEGGYGTVYLLDDAIHGIGIPVVVKVIETKAGNDNNKNSIANEKLASRIMDFSIAPLLAMTVDIPSGKAFFLSPYLENGDLGAKIKEDTDMIKNGKPNEVNLTEIRRLMILYHVSSALDFLHRQMPGFRGGILHLDLTTKNIALDKMWNARLIDFGLSREFKEGSDNTLRTSSKKFGTPGYLQSAYRETLSAEDDYYNFGVVIREILTGQPPTGDQGGKQTKTKMLKDMTSLAVKRKIQKDIWQNASLADTLSNLSKECLQNEKNLAVKQKLLTLLEHSPRWTSNPKNHKCEKCMVNTSAKDCKKLLKHECNCMNPIQVCAACMRNSYLNPIICHSCNKELVPYIGSGWGAILIAGNDTNKESALGFKSDILKVRKIIVSKCPLVMGISENTVELITPDEPGVKENMMTKFETAVESLKRKDVYTLLIYFSGHHYLNKGFMLGHNEEFLTVEVLQRKMKEISIYCSPEAVNEKSSLFSEKRFIVFLDCCEAPDLTQNFSSSEKKCGTENVKPNLKTNGTKPKEEEMPNQNYCILQMNTCGSSYGNRQGSAFTDLFCRCLTQRALQTPCQTKTCDHSKLENDFIRFQDLHDYISQHGEKLNPVMNVKSSLSADLIVAYNVNFNVALEFKIKDSCEQIEVLPEGFTDLQHLQQSVLKRIQDENKSNLLFKGNADIEAFADCTCFEVERGPKETVELETLDELMAAWNSKRDITISMRTAVNIDREKVLVYTGIEETSTIEDFITGSVTLLEGSPRWTSNPGNHKCEKCMVNAAAKDCKTLLKHEFNCRNPIQVCAACMRNSYLNPIICHSCNKELVAHKGDPSLGPVRNITESINTLLDTDPDLTDIIESDKLLSPMWKAMNGDTSGRNGTAYIRSNRPVWITKMKIFLELADKADKNNLSIQWQTIEDTFTQSAGAISLDEPLRREQTKIENGDWDYCVENDCKLGIVYMMKKMGFLPDRQRLNKACKTFGRKSTIMRIICRLICNEIKSSPDDAVWPVYKEKQENDVIFVTICKDRGRRSVPSKHNIMYWSSDYINSENKEVITNEVESNTRIDSDEMKQMKITINANSQKLREHHSNIAMVTASPFRSKGYKTERRSMVKENCIVILVPIKGLIPLQEDVFDRTIGNYETDIREGIFKWHVGGKPSVQHAYIKIGCAIGPATKQVLGTLGGFVEHPVHGLCGLTCAHVVLDEEEIRNQANVVGRICVQPNDTSAAFGTVVDSIFRDSHIEAGLDIALIKLDRRLPVDGNFPDTETSELKTAGFGEKDEIKYTSGKICSDMYLHRDKRIVKYGATTFLRRGVFGFDGMEFAYSPIHFFGKLDLVLKNQIQIYDINKCGRFSDEGDSGALVFMVSGNELEAVGILLGGGDGFSVMTPIRDVLLGLGCREPLTMKRFPHNNVFYRDFLVRSDGIEPMDID